MKLKTVYICQNCNQETPKWLGQCPNCETWNSLLEDVVDISKSYSRKPAGLKKEPVSIDFEHQEDSRLQTRIEEFDRVLGGGITKDSVTLLSGEPGIGKSTLTLKICSSIATELKEKNVLYVSGEESTSQIANRAKRLGIGNKNIKIINETDLENIIDIIETQKPGFFIIDSIQVISSSKIPSIAGSINQVRLCTESLISIAKEKSIPALIIGHVTKDGNLAGPKVLEHLVDTVLLIEGERFNDLRILRGLKNRYGSTNEIGLFEMNETGMTEVKNASRYFLENRKIDAIGSAITVTMEGLRPLLIEVQALTCQTSFGYPKRAASGYDLNRLQLILAIIQKHANLDVSMQDVYINITGGYKLNDPASDLAVIMAIISSLKKIPLPSEALFLGEVGLSGEIRKVGHLTKREQEGKKMGLNKPVSIETHKNITLKNIIKEILNQPNPN
jgi:DNA repair protein RadA/Sms